MIPVSIITGFLGSGKTTLLAHMLRDPAMSRTAIIINEFGAVGLDHDLIETSDESFIQLSNGCLCCNVRTDLVLTLIDLASRRSAGTLPCFERVVIETSGLADPAPILHALMTDSGVCESYALDDVITTVDTVTGLSTIEKHPESVRQIAVADRIILTKTDLAPAGTAAICKRISSINPSSPVTIAINGVLDASTLFRSLGPHSVDILESVSKWMPPESANGKSYGHQHTEEISTFCIVREQPLHGVTLALLLSALADNCGADLLRVKGIVAITEEPERPAVIHGVQHVYHAPVWLDHWPSDDRRTRIVFIGRNIRQTWVLALIDLLDAEVNDQTMRLRATAGAI